MDAAETRDYQTLQGTLLYSAWCTRYDLCFTFSQLSRSASRPASLHVASANRALHYLPERSDFVSTYRKEEFNKLRDFYDASNGKADPSSGKSVSGPLVIYRKGRSASRHQRRRSLRSHQPAEVQGMVQRSKGEMYWLRMLGELGELGARRMTSFEVFA